MPPRALHIDASAPHHRESDTAAPAPGTATKAVDNEYTGYTEPYDRSPTDTAYLPPPSPRGMPATAVNSFDSKTEVGRSEYEDKTSAARQVDNLSDIESQPPTPSSALPPGCKYGTLPREDGTVERVIWVDFPAGSRENPFYFSRSRKLGITLVATFFTFMTGECWRNSSEIVAYFSRLFVVSRLGTTCAFADVQHTRPLHTRSPRRACARSWDAQHCRSRPVSHCTAGALELHPWHSPRFLRSWVASGHTSLR